MWIRSVPLWYVNSPADKVLTYVKKRFPRPSKGRSWTKGEKLARDPTHSSRADTWWVKPLRKMSVVEQDAK